MESLNIAIITHDYPSHTSHAGAFVQARADLYRRLNHQVTVFTRGKTEAPSAADFDVAAAHYPLPDYVIPTSKKLMGQIPVVAYLHGAEAIKTPDKSLLWELRAKRAVKDFARSCNAVVTESRWMKAEVRAYIGIQAQVIPNPVDPVLFPLIDRSGHGHSLRGLCLRGLDPKYGTDILEAAKRQIPEIPIDIPNPRFSREELPGLLSRYDFFVAPSRMEGQGLMACEALSTGMPVVSTRVGGIPEFVKDEESELIGDLSPSTLASAISRIHTKLQSMTMERRQRIRECILQTCGPQVTVEKDIELFKSL